MKKLALTAITILFTAGVVFFWLSQTEVTYQGYILGETSKRKPAGLNAQVAPTPISSQFNIFIPSQGINAPVRKNVDGSLKGEYLPDLLQGVAHYKHKKLPDVIVDGALPGEKGNIFLFGHSQIPGGDKSNYKGVFNSLPSVKVGEKIQLTYQGRAFNYQIYEAKVVSKKEIAYLEKTDQETLTLMTCWPLGLDIKRFMVRAKRINE